MRRRWYAGTQVYSESSCSLLHVYPQLWCAPHVQTCPPLFVPCIWIRPSRVKPSTLACTPHLYNDSTLPFQVARGYCSTCAAMHTSCCMSRISLTISTHHIGVDLTNTVTLCCNHLLCSYLPIPPPFIHSLCYCIIFIVVFLD